MKKYFALSIRQSSLHKDIRVFCCCRSSLVDISSDGSTLAMVTASSTDLTDQNVLVLKWNGTHYTQFLNSLPLQSLQIVKAISLSPDGNALAVGAYDSSNDIVGEAKTTVYKVRRPGCMDNEKLLRISFTTDDFPEENRWTVQYGNESFESQPYNTSQRFMTYNEEICVPADVCIKFSVFDTEGDGIGFPGSYAVMLDGIAIAYAHFGADFSYNETIRISDNCVDAAV